MADIKITDTFKDAAIEFAHLAQKCVKEKGVFNVVLSGGNTAKYFFDALVAYSGESIPWEDIRFFFGDERYVPSNNAQSNYHSAYEHLFSKVGIAEKNIYRIPTEFYDPQDAARQYEKTLKATFGLQDNEFPKFDVLYLGLGDDGHTASLMPGCSLMDIHANQLAAALLWVPGLPDSAMYRITLTIDAINHSRYIVFLVNGINKAQAVKNVLEGTFLPDLYPAQLVHPISGNITWYLDVAAACELSPRSQI